jgi:hypothetical protein
MELSLSWEVASQIINVFTRAHQMSLCWARWIQSMSPQPMYLRLILIQCFHLILGFTVSFLLALRPKSYMNSFYHHSCYLPCLFHRPWFDHCDYIWRRVKLWSSSLCYFIPPPIFSSIFGRNIHITLFWNTIYPSFNVRDQVSHLYKTTAKIIIMCILNFTFRHAKLYSYWLIFGTFIQLLHAFAKLRTKTFASHIISYCLLSIVDVTKKILTWQKDWLSQI